MTFRRSFFFRGLSAVQPPGDYVVDTDEERIETSFGVAYRRIGTWIWLPAVADTGGTVLMTSIEPSQLEAALAVDARLAAPGPQG